MSKTLTAHLGELVDHLSVNELSRNGFMVARYYFNDRQIRNQIKSFVLKHNGFIFCFIFYREQSYPSKDHHMLIQGRNLRGDIR